MDQIYSDQGLVLLLQRMAGNEPTANTKNAWAVYINDATPDRSTVLADLTLNTTDFPRLERDAVDLVLTQVISDEGVIQGPTLVFTNSSGAPIDLYGYAITNHAGTKLIAASRFDSAPVTVPAGDSVLVVPTYAGFSELP